MNSKNKIFNQFKSKTGQIAVLIDPDVTKERNQLESIVRKAEFAKIDYFFIGGSTVQRSDFNQCISNLRALTTIPIVIFPGDYQQLSNQADALLYLSLLSGRNAEYLIGQHVRSAQEVLKLEIEVIPTSYILVDGGTSSSVAYVSQTIPIARDNISIGLNTAIAGFLQGKKVVYFDAGSGAKQNVNPSLVKKLKNQIETIVIVGGGVRTIEQIEMFEKSGANIIVIGTKIEEDTNFLLDIQNYKSKIIG